MNLQQTDTYKAKYYTYLPLIFILCPSFPVLLPTGLGERLIFVMEIGVIFFLGIIRVYNFFLKSIPVLYVYFFLYSILFSLFIDIVNQVAVLSDFFELVKPLAFLLFYLFFRYSTVSISQIEKRTIKVLMFVFTLLVIWSILDVFFPNIFLQASYFLYKRQEVVILRNKAIGSFAQTYQFAYILLLPLTMSFISLLKKKTFWTFISFLLFFFAILMTQSRSMYICIPICLLVCCFLPVLYPTFGAGLRTILLITSVLVIVLCVYIIFQDDLKTIFAYAFQGFESMMKGENNSVNTRQEQLHWAIENNDLFLFGSGIGKGEIMLESFYSLYYYRYGVIGMALYLLMVFYTSKTSYKIARKEEAKDCKVSIFYYSLFVFYLITPLAILSSCHQDTPKISFLFYGLMGLIHLKKSALKAAW